MKSILTLLFILAAKFSFGQPDTATTLIGTWDVCISLDTLDTNCAKPFTFFQLKPNGQFEGPEFTCNDKKESVLGTWKYEKGSIYISSYEGTCFRMPNRGYYQIQFVNKDLFYTRGVSTVGENNGNPIFTVIRRRK